MPCPACGARYWLVSDPEHLPDGRTVQHQRCKACGRAGEDVTVILEPERLPRHGDAVARQRAIAQMRREIGRN